MIQLADAFVAMPEGIGTLEEFFEVYTLAQLGFHSKPCGLLNVNDFFTPLEVMLDTDEKEGFMKNSFREVITWSEGPADLLDRMACCRL